jgi:broad specificity phosphatase PhoE
MPRLRPRWYRSSCRVVDARTNVVQPLRRAGRPAEYAALVAEIFRHPDESIHGCEPAALAQQRIVHTIDSLVAAHSGSTLAVISHGIILALYMCHLKSSVRPDPAAIWRRIGFPDLAVVDPVQHMVMVDFHG